MIKWKATIAIVLCSLFLTYSSAQQSLPFEISASPSSACCCSEDSCHCKEMGECSCAAEELPSEGVTVVIKKAGCSIGETEYLLSHSLKSYCVPEPCAFAVQLQLVMRKEVLMLALESVMVLPLERPPNEALLS